MEQTRNTVEVAGTESFRRVMVLSSMIFAGISIGILALDPRHCEIADPADSSKTKEVPLGEGITVCLGVQLFIFFLLLLHYIHCGCLIRKLGRAMGVFYFALVAAMAQAQYLFF